MIRRPARIGIQGEGPDAERERLDNKYPTPGGAREITDETLMRR